MLVIVAKVNQYLKDGELRGVFTIASNLQKPEDQAKEIAAYVASQPAGTSKAADGGPLFWGDPNIEPGTEITKTQRGYVASVPLSEEIVVIANKMKMFAKLGGRADRKDDLLMALLTQ